MGYFKDISIDLMSAKEAKCVCGNCAEDDVCCIHECDECGILCEDDDWFICGECCLCFCLPCDEKLNGKTEQERFAPEEMEGELGFGPVCLQCINMEK